MYPLAMSKSRQGRVTILRDHYRVTYREIYCNILKLRVFILLRIIVFESSIE